MYYIKNRLKKFLILPILLIGIASWIDCGRGGSDADKNFKDASWIGSQETSVQADSLLYNDNPAPLFRKVFHAAENIQSATLYITAAGYYTAFLNSKRIGDNYLNPAWTQFDKRVYYREFDLTERIRSGANCLGVMVGNGFYNPLPLKMWGHVNLRERLPVGKVQFIARLKIVYTDGRETSISSDRSWKTISGPVKKNNVYLGEVYDARDELQAWSAPGFNDSLWINASVLPGPGGALQGAFFPPIQITDIIKPVSVSDQREGKFLVDMGVNFTGLYRIRMKGEPGDTITFRFGERIYQNGELNPMTAVVGQIKRAGIGGPGAPDIAVQKDQYIFGEARDTVYQPEFTFHTYRYIEITGLSRRPTPDDIQGLALNTNVENDNRFSSSSDLVNAVQSAVRRTFLSNLIGVQSDCPAREKFGYGGDLNATSEAFIYNFDMREFYRKTIYDWIDAQNDSVFVDTAPYVGIRYCGLSWESAFLITQYYLYLYYNDIALVRELYEADLRWMEKVERLHPEGIVESGLSDHESLEPVPVELTGTSHYLQCARIMETFAGLMGDFEQEKVFKRLAEKLQAILQARFWENPVKEPINRQTLYATLLYHNILPPDQVGAAVDSLVHAVENAKAGHFITGIFGTKYVLEALSRAGRVEMVYKIVNSRKYPGWGHMIDRGATTIWETWKESDNTFSNCHPMFGSVSEWFFRWLGGIRPDPEYPGFKQFIYNPSMGVGLQSAECVYQTAYGAIRSHWTVSASGIQQHSLSVPDGTIAQVKLFVGESQKLSICKANGTKVSIPEVHKAGLREFDLDAGSYILSISE